MSTEPVGKLIRVPLRKVWEHEKRDFSRWLQENINVLNSALDFSLVNVNREQSGDPCPYPRSPQDGLDGTLSGHFRRGRGQCGR